jgi:hypothetical protein
VVAPLLLRDMRKEVVTSTRVLGPIQRTGRDVNCIRVFIYLVLQEEEEEEEEETEF